MISCNTQKAKELLQKGSYTLVLYNGNDSETLVSAERGVKPLLALTDSGRDYSDYCSCDKVVGAAAAYLYAFLGVKEVYALTLSEKAKAVFEKYGISFFSDKLVPFIINRQGDGLCPMEQATLDAASAEDAILKIRNKLKEIQR